MFKILKAVEWVVLILTMLGGGLLLIFFSFMVPAVLISSFDNYPENLSFIYNAGLGIFMAAALGLYLHFCILLVQKWQQELKLVEKKGLGKVVKTPAKIFNLFLRLKSWAAKLIKNSKTYKFFAKLKKLTPKQILNRLAAAALTLFRPPQVFVTTPVLVLITLAIFLVPPFIFNEMEYKFRAHFAAGEYLARSADEIIEFRRENASNVIYENAPYSFDEYLHSSEHVEGLIEESLKHIDCTQTRPIK
jgi:hypothetical protein